jgi:hypothetical protein
MQEYNDFCRIKDGQVLLRNCYYSLLLQMECYYFKGGGQCAINATRYS